MPFTVRNGVRIHYRRHGESGPPVVLLQGLGLSSRFWFDLPDRLATRTEGPFRIVAPDNRGTGQSDVPRGRYRMADLADDAVAALDHAGLDDAYVVGISLGGMIAQHVALRHPKRVRGLVLLATTPGLPHGRLAHPRTLATLCSIPFHRRRGNMGPLLELVLAKKDMHRAKELLAPWGPAIRENPITYAGFFGQLTAAVTHSTGRKLHKVACPTVVVTGDADVLIPPKNSRELAKRIPGARLEVLPGVGHGIPIVDEGVVARALDTLHVGRG